MGLGVATPRLRLRATEGSASKVEFAQFDSKQFLILHSKSVLNGKLRKSSPGPNVINIFFVA